MVPERQFKVIFLLLLCFIFSCHRTKYETISYKELLSKKIESVMIINAISCKEAPESKPEKRKLLFEYDTLKIAPDCFYETIRDTIGTKAYSKTKCLAFGCRWNHGFLIVNKRTRMQIPCGLDKSSCEIPVIFDDEDSLRSYRFCFSTDTKCYSAFKGKIGALQNPAPNIDSLFQGHHL